MRNKTAKRKLTKTKASEMAGARKTHAGGRPAKPGPCPKCGTKCESVRKALAHC